MATEVKKTLEQTLKELEKSYGKGSIIHGRDKFSEDGEVIDSGSIGLNHALGIGGISASGKIYEIFGWESSGKSTLCQTIAANFQSAKKKVLYMDGENSLDRKYASALGLNIDDLFIVQLDEHAAEGAYAKMEALVKTGEFSLVIIDSYNSFQPKAVLVDGLVGDAAIGKHARMQGQAVMKANYLSTAYNTSFMFIGQLREKIGVMYGSPQTTQGGNALKFYAHVRMEVTRSITKDNSVMNGDVKLGNQVTIKVIKNKLGAPFTKCELDVLYGIGFDKIGELLILGKKTDILSIRAGKVTYNEVKYEEGEFRELLINNSEFLEEIKGKILNALNNVDPDKIEEENEAEVY